MNSFLNPEFIEFCGFGVKINTPIFRAIFFALNIELSLEVEN